MINFVSQRSYVKFYKKKKRQPKKRYSCWSKTFGRGMKPLKFQTNNENS